MENLGKKFTRSLKEKKMKYMHRKTTKNYRTASSFKRSHLKNMAVC